MTPVIWLTILIICLVIEFVRIELIGACGAVGALAGLIACRPDYYSHSDPGSIEIPGGRGDDICGDIQVLDGEIAEPVPDDPEEGELPDYELSGYVGG